MKETQKDNLQKLQKSLRISVVLPTRGIVFAEVEHEIEKMRCMYDITVFRSWDKSLPHAQNYLVDKALKINPDYILFIEEDTIPPAGALTRLLETDGDIAFIDYGVNGWSCSAKDQHGIILWCGFGCTLVKREVFTRLPKPYFRTDKTFRLNDWEWVDRPAKYGGQDIWFCLQATEKGGFTIKQAAGECKHMKIDALGMAGVNNGRHVLSQKSIIVRYQVVEKPDDLLTKDTAVANVSVIRDRPTAL